MQWPGPVSDTPVPTPARHVSNILSGEVMIKAEIDFPPCRVVRQVKRKDDSMITCVPPDSIKTQVVAAYTQSSSGFLADKDSAEIPPQKKDQHNQK